MNRDCPEGVALSGSTNSKLSDHVIDIDSDIDLTRKSGKSMFRLAG